LPQITLPLVELVQLDYPLQLVQLPIVAVKDLAMHQLLLLSLVPLLALAAHQQQAGLGLAEEAEAVVREAILE
jgi:hypothetical protein